MNDLRDSSIVKHEIYFLRVENPEWTLQKIGDCVGVCREYARQVLKSRKLPTKSLREKKVYFCEVCNKSIDSAIPVKYHKDCYHSLHWKKVKCDNCGVVFEKNLTTIKRNQAYPNHGNINFCNRKCQGQYLGKHYGAGRKG